MNRETKFRVWDEYTKKMIMPEEVELLVNSDGVQECPIDSGDGCYSVGVMLEYTGLKDKNGVEIYEGDLIRRLKNCMFYEGYLIDEVIFKDGIFRCDTSLISLVEHFDPEVIGNIYEAKNEN